MAPLIPTKSLQRGGQGEVSSPNTVWGRRWWLPLDTASVWNMPLCELNVRANPSKQYTVGDGVQLWTWSPVSASAFSNPVETPRETRDSSQKIDSLTRVIESSTDLTDVLKFSQKFSANERLANITGNCPAGSPTCEL